MSKVRILHMDKTSRDLFHEELHFTEDLDTPAKDFLRPGYVVISDTVHEMVLPNGFPTDHTFVRMEF
jgi:hypothetical protein